MAKHLAKCPRCDHPFEVDTSTDNRVVCPECRTALTLRNKMRDTKEADGIIGQTLGEFEILARLGRGGMGSVYKAWQPSLNRYVAIKVLPESVSADLKFLERFSREARAAAKVNHANIVTVYSVGKDCGHTYIAMEFVEGESLWDIIRHRMVPPASRVLRMIKQSAAALARAHKAGIIHRDIKPSNILVTTDGDVKIVDFGIAKRLNVDTSLTSSGTPIGTPQYISPEVVSGREVDARSDLYSLGATFYHVLAGRPPFEGGSSMELAVKHVNDAVPPLAQTAPHAPAVLCHLVHRLLRKDPNRRYKSAEQLVLAIEQVEKQPVVSDEPERDGQSRLPSSGHRRHGQQETPRRHLPHLVGLACIVFVALAITVLVFWNHGGEKAPAPPVDGRERQKTQKQAALAKSRQALEVAERYERENPEDLAGIEQAYARVLEHPSREAETTNRAKAALKQVRERIQTEEATVAFERAKAKAADMIEKRDYDSAAKVFQVLARERPRSRQLGALEEANRILAEAETACDAELARAHALLQRYRIDEAKELLENLAKWGSKSAVERASDELYKLNMNRDQLLAEFQETIKKQQMELAAIIAARKYKKASVCATKLAGVIGPPDNAEEVEKARLLDRLAALKGKLVSQIDQHPLKYEFSAKGAVGKIEKADAEGISVAAGDIHVRSSWGEIPSRRIPDLLGQLISADDADGHLDAALWCAWEAQELRAKQFIERARTAAGDQDGFDAQIRLIESVSASREIEKYLCEIRQFIAQHDYQRALRGIAVLSKKMNGAPENAAHREEIQELKATCQAHIAPCPRCVGGGFIECPDCEGAGSLMGRRRCPVCGGDGTRERYVPPKRDSEGVVRQAGHKVPYECGRCDGAGTIPRKAVCPKCRGKGQLTCPRCKGKGSIEH